MIETPLYACELDMAPAYRWQNPSGTQSPPPLFHGTYPPPPYEIAIYYVCTLRSNFSNLPRNKFGRHKNSMGQEYYHFEFLLRMTLSNEVRSISPNNWVCVGYNW